MRTKIQLSDAMGHLKGLRVRLAKGSYYVKTVRQWLTISFFGLAWAVHLKSKVSRLFSIKFQIWPGWIQAYITGPKPEALEPRMWPQYAKNYQHQNSETEARNTCKEQSTNWATFRPDSVTDFQFGPVISSVKTINSWTVSSPNSCFYSISRGPLDAKHLGFLGLELQVKCLGLVLQEQRTSKEAPTGDILTETDLVRQCCWAEYLSTSDISTSVLHHQWVTAAPLTAYSKTGSISWHLHLQILLDQHEKPSQATESSS